MEVTSESSQKKWDEGLWMILLQKEAKTKANYRELQMEFTKSIEWFCNRMSDYISEG